MKTLRGALLNNDLYSGLKGLLVEKKGSFKRLPSKIVQLTR